MPRPADPHPADPTPRRWSRFDRALLWLIAAIGAIGSLVLLVIPHFFIPAEDSVILFLFSRNLATTGAITFFAHGPHAEGATDFLWMVLIAGAMKLHIDPYWFVSSVNIVSLILIAVVLIRIAGRRVHVLPLLFITGVFALMPEYCASLQAFSTLPFALLLVLLVYAFLEQKDIRTPLLALVLCLFRPDGIVFAVPILTAALWIYPARSRRFLLDLGLFVVPGLIYFFWRWHYFGHMLPLPFLVKSDTPRFAHLIVTGTVPSFILPALFAAPLVVLALRGHFAERRNLAVFLCILVMPSFFYLAMRLDQNIGNRFFIYVITGVGLLTAMNWSTLGDSRRWMLRIGCAIWLLVVFPASERGLHGAWGGLATIRKGVATDLAVLPHGTLLTTEAGVVPYYSNWPSYDPWGLNTAEFAEHLFQPADVARIHPDLILVNLGGGSPLCIAQQDWQTPYATRDWSNMTRNLIAGADAAHYDLWLVPTGNLDMFRHLQDWQGNHECWFVRHNSPLRPAVERIFAAHRGLPADVYYAHIAADAATQSTAAPTLIDRLRNLWHSWF